MRESDFGASAAIWRPPVTFAAVFVSIWFALAFTLSFTGWFERFTAAELFGLGSVISGTSFAALHRHSETFRGFVRARSLKRMTYAQLLRLYGILALVKADQRVLPQLFAIPTALMDVFIACGAFYVASALVTPDGRARRGYRVYHLIGLATLGTSAVLAVLTSTTWFGVVKDGVTSQALTWFPMSLVPTFIGPFVLIMHLQALVVAFHTPVPKPQ
ncbi:MAG: hypothetical protein JWN34_65 [Bryobacterales bacterium]|nr:hypothetical protein [Bryobacterales bacterium]